MILLLNPYFEKKPWAGDKLNLFYDCPSSTGEAWIVSGYKNKSSVIRNGIYKGQTLRKVFKEHEDLFSPFKEKEFPLLLKLISSSEKLSIQVHPNDDYALKKHNRLGKFECWYVLKENESNEVIHGINLKNATELKCVLKEDKLEEYLVHKTIKENDLIIVEPGKVHALQENSFVLEIQESSDITYRLYDYKRIPKRELHIEDSLNVINYNNDKNYIYQFEENDNYNNAHFSITKKIVKNKLIYANNGLEVFYVISGFGMINGIEIKKGDAFISTSEDKNDLEFQGNIEFISILPKEKEMSRMRKTALITGIISQDGYYLTKLLLEKNYEVHGLVQSYAQFMTSEFKKFMDHDNFFVHVGDMTDTSNINRLLENIKPDEIYHLASQSHVNLSFDMPDYTTQVNALGTLKLLDAIKNSEMRTKLFNLSSAYLFSGDTFPQNELTPFDVKSPYAVSKLYAHKMVEIYRNNYYLFAVNGICYNHESPFRSDIFVAPKIINAIKKIRDGEDYVLELGNLNAKREWGFAKDYAYAMWLLLQQDKPKDYIIATGIAYTVREFVTKAFEHIGKKIVWSGEAEDEVGIDEKTNKILVKVNPKYLRPNDAKVLVGDSTKLFNDTSFKFHYDLDRLIDTLLNGE